MTGRRTLCAQLAAGVVMLAALGAWTAPPASAAEPATVTLSREIAVSPDVQVPGVNLTNLDVSARRLVVSTTSPAEYVSYDLDSGGVAERVSSPSRGLAAALDPDRHVLYGIQLSQSIPPTLLGLDTRSLDTVVRQPLPAGMYDQYEGLLWSARDQLLYMVYQPVLPTAATPLMVAAIDPRNASGNPVLWQASLPGCQSGLGQASNTVEVVGQTHDARYLVTACIAGGAGLGAVARLALPQDPRSVTGVWSGAVDIFPGVVTGTGARAAWAAGEDRMVIMSQSNSGSGWSAYVFDATTLHFVTAPSLYAPQSDGNVDYQPPAMGVDPAGGRMLAWSFGVASYGRGGQQGTPCQPRAAGTNTVAVDETAMEGVSVLHFPVAGDDFQAASGSIAYDPVGRNWWMLALKSAPPSACDWGTRALATELVVFHDGLPPGAPPPHAGPDRGTADVAEQPGVTGANSSADASAYGARYVVGPSGTEGAMRIDGGSCDLAAEVSGRTATSPIQPPAGVPPLPPQYHAFCNADGNTATFAHVDRVALDSAEARGTAVAGDTDQYTGRDLATGTDASHPGGYVDAVSGYAHLAAPCPPGSTAGQPTTCDEDVAAAQPYLSGLALPYTPATCADGGGGEAAATSRAPLQVHDTPPATAPSYPGGAWVDCSFAEPKVLGHADQASLGAGGPLGAPVSAFAETADAHVGRTAATGSIGSATATVQDIAVGDVLHIASLTATAAVQAHGRPGTNPPSYTCTVQGVSVTLPAGVSLPPGVPASIASASCNDPNLWALVAALNALLGTKVHIAFPAALRAADHPAGGDAAVALRQSPRGFLSQVALSDLDLAQDSILVNDTSIEQPAMVVTWYLDNANARNRLVASFAGVAATARYGIYRLGDAGGGDVGGDLGGGALGQAGTGTVPGPLGAAVEGGFPPGPAPAAPSPVAPSARAGWGAVPGAVVDGVRFLLQHPGLIPPVLAVWLLFAAPGCILARRRALLRAI